MSVQIGRAWPGSGSQLGEARGLSALPADPSACGSIDPENLRYGARLRYESADNKGSKWKFRLNGADCYDFRCTGFAVGYDTGPLHQVRSLSGIDERA